MGDLSRLLIFRGSGAFRLALSLLLITLFATVALAAPVTYTGVTITSGQLGSWTFHNARVYVTFQTDTSFVQQTTIAGVNVAYVGPFPAQQLCTGTPTSIGTARVTIVKGETKVQATFAPNQIFVSLDQDNGGVGFGSCDPNGNFEPAYPLGLAGGTIFGAIFAPNIFPSPEMAALSTDLAHNTAFSGRAWVCVGFPTFGKPCSAPNPLHTNKGDLILRQPYQAIDPTATPPSFNDPLGGGLFTAVVNGPSIVGDVAQAPILAQDDFGITYNGMLITDVTLGAQHYTGALVYISFASDPRNVFQFADPVAYGFVNFIGRARVTIVANNQSITTHFAPGQLFVYYDIKNTEVGFGSFAGGIGYPLAFTATQPTGSFFGFQHSTLGAVSDITRTPADAVNYTPATASLLTNFRNSTTLSGNASSCGALDPATAICSNLTPTPLSTGLGSFSIFEPYTDDVSMTGTQQYSGNFGVFWTERSNE